MRPRVVITTAALWSQKLPLSVAFGVRAFGHVGNFKILEDIEIPGVSDDQLMTGLIGILVS